MKIVFTKHVLIDSIPRFKLLGWKITKAKIKQTINKPVWVGVTKYGQSAAMGLMDNNHILRVVFEKKDDIIRVITAYIARKGKYESTKEN